MRNNGTAGEFPRDDRKNEEVVGTLPPDEPGDGPVIEEIVIDEQGGGLNAPRECETGGERGHPAGQPDGLLPDKGILERTTQHPAFAHEHPPRRTTPR